MAKFCGKCGSRLDEATGLCPRCDNSEEMSQENKELQESNGGPKKTKKRKVWLRVFVVVLVLLVGIGTGAILWIQFGDPQVAKELATSNSELSIISGESITESISSSEEAVSVLAKVGPELGYQNAFSELAPVYIQDVLDLTTYRLQQYYEGIPVYGRTASIISDTEGEVILCVNNCEDIDSFNLANEIKITEDEAKKIVSKIRSVSEVVSSKENDNSSLLLFKAEDGYHYAYVIFASADDISGSTIEYYIDADDGSVLANYVSVCDMSKTVSYSQDGFSVSITESDGELSLIDTSRGIYIYDWEGQNSDKESSEAQLVSCPTGDIFDTSSVQFLSILSSLYDYFVNNYADCAYGSLIACYNDSADWGKNASGGSATQNDMTRGYMTVGKITGTGDVDVIGHEYTHIIEKHLFNPQNSASEAGAINEGLADLYGSILEAFISNKNTDTISDLVPDWIMQGDNIDAYRNAIDPSDSGNATTVQDKKGLFSRGDKYYFATIVPRAAYLMWNGIDGNEAKKLDTKTLSDLWYLSMTMFPSDVDFELCGNVVESVAALLNSRGVISDAQLSCVDEAFSNVGITGRTDILEYAEKLGRPQDDMLPTDHLSPENATTAYAEALDKLNGKSFSITKEGSFLADFVNFSELQFTQTMDIQGFGEPTMTASGHYASTGGSGGSTSEMDYDFTYDSQGMHIPDYEQPVTGELVTLELPPLECVHSYSETEGDGDGKTYLVTYDGEALTQENCGILSSALTSPYRIYWSPSEEYADEDGIQEASILFSLDRDGNLTSIEVTYKLIAGIQGTASAQGKTSFVLGESSADQSPMQTQIPNDAVVFNNHSYYVYDLDSVTTWEEAEEYCESLGGHLATITSTEEDDFLFDYVSNLGYGSVLFGLSDANQEGLWVWVTGEEVAYENWASGEPNNQGGYEHFGQYYEKNTDGSWNDGSGKTCPFLCEWDERKPQSETIGAESRWSEFISSGEYTEFTSQMRDYGGNQLETQYALLDIDGDGWEEMVLYALSDGVGFGFHAVLSCDKTTGTISFVPIETDMTDGTTGYSNIVQDFRGVSYSAQSHALCYSTMNNGMTFGSTGFWVLKDGQMNCDFSVGFDQPQEYWDALPDSASTPMDPIYYISDDNGRTEISKEEYDSYIVTGSEPIKFQTFP